MKTTDLLTLTIDQRKKLMPAARSYLFAVEKAYRWIKILAGFSFGVFLVIFFTNDPATLYVGGGTVLATLAALWLRKKEKYAVHTWLMICYCPSCARYRAKVQAGLEAAGKTGL